MANSMGRRSLRSGGGVLSKLLLGLGIFLLFPLAVAQGGAYCVRCVEPEATYLCQVTGTGAEKGDSRLFCLISLAKRGGHASCALARDVTVAACAGTVVTLSPAASGAGEANQRPDDPVAVAPEPPHQQEKSSKKEPETLVEFTRQLGNNTQKALKKAGKSISKAAKTVGRAVSKAAKTTTKCVVSLMTDCR